MSKRKKIVWASLFLAIIAGVFLFQWVVVYTPPKVQPLSNNYTLNAIGKDTLTYGPNWVVKNAYSEWVSYVEGSPYERGIALGELHRERIQSQEAAFVGQLEEHLPQAFYRNLLRLGLAWFNRNLDQQVPIEYRKEIYGVSLYFSDEYDFVGPKYNRILNYHAAHDIGHMAQNMNLVACSAIAEWNESNFYLGRNFDFYFGDDFAKNKIIQFYVPDSGLAFATVTWGGLCGVVSAMNEEGLAITLNALPSDLPTGSGTPVSIIAREIVQYASTIDEAFQIAKEYPAFVSESFTIASAKDHRAAVIEKTPLTTDLYTPSENQLIVTNHYQGSVNAGSELNSSHLAESESMYRFNRLKELSNQDTSKLSPQRILRILRDQKGLSEENLGFGNPMAINQLIAHHSVIFDPIHKWMWVSQSPYQEGAMMAFDVSRIRQMKNRPDFAHCIDSLSLPADPFLNSLDFAELVEYRQRLKNLRIQISKEISISSSQFEELIELNPFYYEAYMVAGDYFLENDDLETAKFYYQRGLACAIPYTSYRQKMESLF